MNMEQDVKQPAPNLMSKDQFYELLQKNGGYLYVPGVGAVEVTNGPCGELYPVMQEITSLRDTPEGEWK